MWIKWLYATQIEADTVRDGDHPLRKEVQNMKIHIELYRTVNYCFFFCYSVFWIPTQQDTIFILNRISTTVTNNIIDLFQETFPKIKREVESPCRTQHSDLLFVCLFVLDQTHWHTHFFIFFFWSVCFSHHNIAEKSRNKIHTGSGFSKRRKKSPPLGVFTLLYMIISPATSFQTLWPLWPRGVKRKKKRYFHECLLPASCCHFTCSQSIAAPPTEWQQ